jgi:hypothetical protein
MNVFLNPADKGFPLQPGFELYIIAPDEEPNPKLGFRFAVALDEPGVVAETMNKLAPRNARSACRIGPQKPA